MFVAAAATHSAFCWYHIYCAAAQANAVFAQQLLWVRQQLPLLARLLQILESHALRLQHHCSRTAAHDIALSTIIHNITAGATTYAALAAAAAATMATYVTSVITICKKRIETSGRSAGTIDALRLN